MLMAILLLGMDAMQLLALREASANYYFSIAQQQINIMNERINLLKNEELNFFITTWNKQNKEVLPNGKGNIKTNPDYEASIYWGNRDEHNCKTNQTGADGCLHYK